MKKQITTPDSPTAPFLSQALISDGFIFVSGMVHITPDGKLVEGTVEVRLAQVMKNIENILKSANATLNNIVKVTVYVTDINDLPELNKYYQTYFEQPYPVREAVCVSALPLGASIEISVIAEIKE